MKKLIAIIPFIIILLAGNVLATLTYGEWDDGSTHKTITETESAYFLYAITSFNPPIQYSVTMSNGYTFTEGSTNNQLIDGSFTVDQSIYQEPGDYIITIYGIDAMNDEDFTELTLTVNPIPNQAPYADFYFTPQEPYVNEVVTFTSNSYDPDGHIVLYEWDFNNDGYYEETGQTTTHVFTEPGVKRVGHRVTDDDGATDVMYKTVEVLEEPPINIPPTAYFTYSPENPVEGETVTFDATDSYDPDGHIIRYEWRFEGEEYHEEPAITTHVFDEDGTYYVHLRVTDNEGATDTTHRLIEVEEEEPENIPPEADFIFHPTNPLIGEEVTFTSTSHDPDGHIILYEWDFNNDGTYEAQGEVAYHTFNEPGRHTVSHRVTDNEGATDTESKLVLVSAQLIIDELGCNPHVVQGHEQHCSAHVSLNNGENIEDVHVTFFYQHNNREMGDCYTNSWGYCHINPIIYLEPGNYTVYAEAVKEEPYIPDYTHSLTTDFTVWAERYEIRNFDIYEDPDFSIPEDTFYRYEAVYTKFRVYDLVEQEYVTDHGIVTEVFLRVNNGDPLYFEEWPDGLWGLIVNLFRPSQREYFKYWLEHIPLSDDYLGEGLVFAFAFNFSDNTAGQASREITVLNNELTFDLPKSFEIEMNSFIDIDMNEYVYDLETPDEEIVITHTNNEHLTIEEISTNIFRVTPEPDYTGEVTISFTADDTDGSTKTKRTTFIITEETLPPVIILYHENIGNLTIRFDASDSYDPDGGEIVRYTWDFGDMSGIVSGNSPIVTHKYPHSGYFNMSLTVTDDERERTTLYRTIYVEEEDMYPVASFTATISDSHPREVIFDASESYDPDGSIVSYYWEFDDNETLTTDQPVINHRYDSYGVYFVTLTVTDNDGLTGDTLEEVNVRNPFEDADFDCNDGIDNDHDGLIDYPEDPGCVSLTDDSEYNIPLGGEDGLVIPSISVYGVDRDVGMIDDYLVVRVAVRNNIDEKIDGIRVTFKIPELGIKQKSSSFNLRSGEQTSRQLLIYIPYYEEPGEYYAEITVSNTHVIRQKNHIIEII
jgi:PKD repeat protein